MFFFLWYTHEFYRKRILLLNVVNVEKKINKLVERPTKTFQKNIIRCTIHKLCFCANILRTLLKT